MISVTRKFHFSYAHKLPNYPGNCSRLHGHNAIVEVTFEPTGENTGIPMVIDFREVKQIVSPIIEELDHKYLNDIVSYPSAEAIAKYIADKIIETYPSTNSAKAKLTAVKVFETENCWAEWKEK